MLFETILCVCVCVAGSAPQLAHIPLCNIGCTRARVVLNFCLVARIGANISPVGIARQASSASNVRKRCGGSLESDRTKVKMV